MKAKDILVAVGIVGAAAGGFAAGMFYEKNKLTKIHEEEIAEIKATYKAKLKELNETEPETREEDLRKPESRNHDNPDLMEYIHETEKYSNQKVEPEEVGVDIAIIPPDEFGLIEDYEKISLKYTDDGVILDDDDDLLEDPEDYLGYTADEISSHFGEYEEDSVFVVNNGLSTYYEILHV